MLQYFKMINDFLLGLLHQKTVGAQAMVISGDKILLVKHTYTPKWYTVGGAVERGETPVQAIQRELMEEVGVRCLKPPKLFHVYLNNHDKKDDYVVLYIVDDFDQVPVKSPEILASQWFNLKALPDDATAATFRRVEEYFGLRVIDEKW